MKQDLIYEDLYDKLVDKVVWDKVNHRHMLGSKVLTNKDMDIMCSSFYRLEYDILPSPLKRKLRESIFYKLRYGKNDD